MVVIIVVIIIIIVWLFPAKAAILATYLTELSFYSSGKSLFFFLRPASSLDVAKDPQYNTLQ